MDETRSNYPSISVPVNQRTHTPGNLRIKTINIDKINLTRAKLPPCVDLTSKFVARTEDSQPRGKLSHRRNNTDMRERFKDHPKNKFAKTNEISKFTKSSLAISTMENETSKMTNEEINVKDTRNSSLSIFSSV
jgi:hypothetical protein